MIYNVLVYDEYGHLIDLHRIGAWDIDCAEDYTATKLVHRYGVDSLNKNFRLVAEGRLFLRVPADEVAEAREAFFFCLGLDTATSV